MLFLIFVTFFTYANEKYQIGDEWGKRAITREQLAKESLLFQKVAKATGALNGGTAFYIGFIAGEHVVATNYHICRHHNCERSMVIFPMIQRSASVKYTYGSWPEIDFSLHALEISEESAKFLAPHALKMNLHQSPYRGQELMTMGFGHVGNTTRFDLMVNQDHDCKVFSAENEFRFLPDSDQINQSKYSAWSFANGCDVSHGDSGSAMVDRMTGEVVGVIWSGTFPKKAFIQSSSYLDQLLANPTEVIWTELSYAVPSFIIHGFFEYGIRENKFDGRTTKLLNEMIKLWHP